MGQKRDETPESQRFRKQTWLHTKTPEMAHGDTAPRSRELLMKGGAAGGTPGEQFREEEALLKQGENEWQAGQALKLRRRPFNLNLGRL